MTVISSTPSALLSETICSVYRGRHKQTVFLIFLSQAVRLQGSLPAIGEGKIKQKRETKGGERGEK